MTTTPTARATPSAQDTVAPDIGDSQDIMFLIVDLDGTLLRSDMLYESFWSAFGRNWRVAFGAAAALRHGRASLKRHLAGVAHLEPASLPYDETVLDYIRDWRGRGGKTALVTASDQSIADKIAAHLGLFDEVYGSDGEDNLKGARKATFLTDRFGAGTFVYMGDSEADLPVWQASARGVTVNASAALRSRSEAAAPEMAHLDTT